MAKKKTKKQPPQLTPYNYIKTKARTLPFYKCYLNSDWMEEGLANIVVARQHTNGNFTLGVYIVDTFCMGLIDTFARFNEKQDVLDDIVRLFIPQKEDFNTLINVDYALVHNIIYGAIGFAEDYNHKPYKDFSFTQFILEEDDERVEFMDIDFGVNGEPFFIDRTEKEDEDEDEDEDDVTEFEEITDEIEVEDDDNANDKAEIV